MAPQTIPTSEPHADPSQKTTAETIAAISTAGGAGAIGIVRMSGPQAVPIARQVFRPFRGGADRVGAESHRLLYGHIVGPASGEIVDEVLLAVMRAPATYTREDVVEVHCHGGPAAQRAVLVTLLQEGARPAEPGEFTKRAFLNGRIDLTQAESVSSVIRARTTTALRAAVRQLEGGLGDRLRDLRRELVSVLAELEAGIDFSEEDIDDLDRGGLTSKVAEVSRQLGGLLATAFTARALEEGVRTAIVGRPNVGKSSLLNALLMRERAIVSEVPGTTRDTIEETLECGGILLRLVDTAGLREGRDHVEVLGIERSRAALDTADLILAVFDAVQGLSDEDCALLAGVDPGRAILVANKIDLLPAPGIGSGNGEGAWWSESGWLSPGDGLKSSAESGEDLGPLSQFSPPILVSATTGDGIGELRDAVSRLVLEGQDLDLEEPLLATERQRRLTEEAHNHSQQTVRALEEGLSDELVSEDLRAAIVSLGAITGESIVPDLIDEIFTRFCIGK